MANKRVGWHSLPSVTESENASRSVMSGCFSTAARQAPLSVGFSRHKCRTKLPFPSLGDLPNPGIECR